MSNEFPLQQTLAEASMFSVVDKERLKLIARSALQQAQKAKGDFIELGVYRGGSALLLARILNHHGASKTLHLLDSWSGLPELANEDSGTFVTPGQFSDSSEDAVRARLDGFKLLDIIKTYRGWVEETLPALHGPFSFVHIDLDLYKPIHFALTHLLPRMTDDGEIIVDDYGNDNLRRFPGVEKAVSECIADSGWRVVETAGERDQSVRLSRKA